MTITTDGTRDEILASGKWTFDQDVTAAFDDMLRRSIPQYDLMRATTLGVAHHFVQPGTAVIDLGASRGEAIAPLVETYADKNQFVCVEISPPMLEVMRQRFGSRLGSGVEVFDMDLRTKYPPVRSSVTLCVLTLQFTPIEYRQRIMQSIYDHTLPGGALILVEKVLGGSAQIDDIMVDEYYRMKEANGYTREEIERKRLSLEGTLVPVTARWNEDLLRTAGFEQIDCIWRWMNFAGWVAVRSSR